MRVDEMKTVMFVCTGNTCRSPMAQYLFQQMAGGRAVSASAGLTARDGSPASACAQEAMREIGIDISAHRSRLLTPDLIHGADAVVAMGKEHYYMLLHCGAPKERLYLLGSGIEDPYGGSLVVYRQCRNKIEEALKALLPEVMGDA